MATIQEAIDELKKVFGDEVSSVVDKVIDQARLTPDTPYAHEFAEDYFEKVAGAVLLAELAAQDALGLESKINEATKARSINVTRFYSKKVVNDAISDIHSAVVARQVMDSEREEVINKAIQKALDYSELVASNESSATYAFSNEDLNINAGFRYYIYQTSEDEAVRPHHATRNGFVFVYGQARSSADIPKLEHQCRCRDIAVTVDEIISDGLTFFYSDQDFR